MAEDQNMSVEEIMAQIMEKAAAKTAGTSAEKQGWSMDEIDDLLKEEASVYTPKKASDHTADADFDFHEEEYEAYMTEEMVDEYAYEDIPAPTEENPAPAGYEDSAIEEEELFSDEEETPLEEAEEEAEEDLSAEDKAISFVDKIMKEANIQTYRRADRMKTQPLEIPITDDAPTELPDPEPQFPSYCNYDTGEEEEEEPVSEVAESEEYEEDTDPAEDKKNRFFGRLRGMKNSMMEFLQGGMEEEEEFNEEEYDDDYEPEVPVQKVTGTETFTSAEEQKTRVFQAPVTSGGSQVLDSTQQIHIPGELAKGVDENPDSPKMIMELADENPENEWDKRALADKTVGIHPIHNENIQHQIHTSRIEHSGGGMATDKYREKFLNKPKQKLETTAEYEALHADDEPGMVERPGFLVKKSKFSKTADLEPIPTIIAADADLNTFDKTIVAKGDTPTIEHEDTEIDGQIKLLGFDDEEEPTPQVDEDAAEEVLREKRVQKIKEFKIDPGMIEEPEAEAMPDEKEYEDVTSQNQRTLRISKDAITSDYLEDEYKKTSDKNRILEGLAGTKRMAFISMIAQGVVVLIAAVLCLISKGSVDAIGGNATVYIFVNLVLLMVAIIFGIRTIIKGVRGFFNKKINAAGATTIVAFVVLLEELILALVSTASSVDVGVYTAAAALSLFAASLTRYLNLRRAKDNFEFITGGTQIYASDTVEDEDDSFEIGRGLLIADPTVNYSAKVKKPKKFVENSFADDPADYDVPRPTLMVLMVAILISIIFAIVKHSALVGLGLFTASVAIALPCFVTLASNIGLYVVDYAFSRKGSVILGHRAVEESAEMNAYAIDSSEIFPKESISIIGIKTFHNMRIDDAILYSSAMAIAADNPLSGVFESTILGKRDLLPPVETIAYEERLGLSAWIHGRRVLFGNRDLLINHNVEVPEEEFEKQYTHNGRKVLYLAIAGKMAAMFVIQYRADKRMRTALQNADRAGITLLVRNTDCNITEDMICHYYKLPLSAVKILSPVSGDIFQKYRNGEKLVAGSGLLHDGTVEASLRTVYEARRLYDAIFTNTVIASAYSIIALLLCVVLAAVTGPEGITDFKIVLFQTLFSVVAVGLPWLQSRHVSK